MALTKANRKAILFGRDGSNNVDPTMDGSNNVDPVWSRYAIMLYWLVIDRFVRYQYRL